MAEFPEDWTVTRLGEVFDIGSSKRVFQSQWRTSGIPFYRARDIVGFIKGEDAVGGLFIAPELYEEFKRMYGVPGIDDLLVTGVGTLGKVYRVTDSHPFYFKDGNIIWLKTKGMADSRYIEQLFVSGHLDEQVFDTAGGSTVGTYTITSARKTIVVLPSLPEQRRIADALGAVDKLIDNLTRRIEKKRLVKQGVMQELLTGKKRLPGFKGEWSTRNLGSMGMMLKGSGLSKEQVGLYGKHKCILYGDLFTKYRLQVKTCFGKTNSDEGLLSRNGDVLVPGSTTTEGIDLATATCVCEDGIHLGGDIIVIRNSFQAFDPLFLAAVISFVNREGIAEIAQGTTIIHLHPRQLSSICYTIPDDTAEQRAIAAVLSDMDAEIAKLEAKRDKYINIKQGMMNDMLTGKVRI